ncbi:N-hydroxyarylamine O-acetyltransferase [Chitinophaga costaii]|uniref:N-hydroxyarylamine O-acetyltransferase n=1 Tax=Chitinophaga costaii TaxID=1335309 RepID=A0A1C3Z0B6_9BACT|nr:arylamine N-acetyltransferase [Chitinophaga costaii]PUZ30181.1 hypothetical protein DCM91_01525 [Chitinophaga costaii]SCB75816.1 N-hydroxyarylamine O-acetyltransferase [Chitinophaga costaii]
MNLEKYLSRIHYTGEIKPDLATLQELQRLHVLHVPFEDIDIYCGIPIVLSPKKFFQKIVIDQRGGYCYEVNELFYHLLRAVGFTVRRISGRLVSGPRYGPEFDHLAICVTLDDQQWLVDVGYGDFALQPLAITPGLVQHDGHTEYVITDGIVVDGQSYYQVSKWSHAKQKFSPDFIFSLIPRPLFNFEPMNRWKQTAPESKYRQTLICSLPVNGGRVSLVGNKLVRTHGQVKQVTIVPEGLGRDAILRSVFNIYLPLDKYTLSKSLAHADNTAVVA